MPVVNGEYTPRSTDRIAETVATELRREFGDDIDLTDSSAFSHIVGAWSRSVHDVQEQQLEDVYDAAYIDSATGADLDNVVSILGISRQESQRATGMVSFERNDEAVTDYTIPEGTPIQTGGDEPVIFRTTNETTISEGDTSTTVNIRAVDGGVRGNVAAGSITVMPTPPSGVESAINYTPTGDSDLSDLNDDDYVTGTNTESDDELRERAKSAVSGGAVATRDAIYSALVNDLPEVQSATIFVNTTTNDYRDNGGLPPVSFEAVVHGGDDEEIATTLFDEMALTARSYGGAHGVETKEVVRSSNQQTYSVYFSRPNIQTLTIDITVVVDNTYIGSSELKDILIEYIGGTDAAGAQRYGAGVGEDIYIDTIRDFIVGAGGEQTGVIGISDLQITDSVGTSLLEDNPVGLTIVPVASDTVAETSPTDIAVTAITQ